MIFSLAFYWLIFSVYFPLFILFLSVNVYFLNSSLFQFLTWSIQLFVYFYHYICSTHCLLTCLSVSVPPSVCLSVYLLLSVLTSLPQISTRNLPSPDDGTTIFGPLISVVPQTCHLRFFGSSGRKNRLSQHKKAV